MTAEEYQKKIDEFLNRNRGWITVEAEALYLNHNEGTFGRAKCKCDACRYIRHMRHPQMISCPFGHCPQCAPKELWPKNPKI